jgi:hypothetical protein
MGSRPRGKPKKRGRNQEWKWKKAKVKSNLMNIEKKGRDKSPKGASTFFLGFFVGCC